MTCPSTIRYVDLCRRQQNLTGAYITTPRGDIGTHSHLKVVTRGAFTSASALATRHIHSIKKTSNVNKSQSDRKDWIACMTVYQARMCLGISPNKQNTRLIWDSHDIPPPSAASHLHAGACVIVSYIARLTIRINKFLSCR